MDLNKSEPRNKKNLINFASNIVHQLTDSIEELGSPVTITASQPCGQNVFRRVRAEAIEQLHSNVQGTNVQDWTDIPVKSCITNAVLLNTFSGELKELNVVKQNLKSNVEYIEDLQRNRVDRDKRLLEIVDGLKTETNAIEEENNEDELRRLRKHKKTIRRVLDTILEVSYPDIRDDIKDLIQFLYTEIEDNNEYHKVPDNVALKAIMVLSRAYIIELHEDDPSLIRLAI